MKVVRLVLCFFVIGVVASSGQNSAGPMEWTPWAPVEGGWAQFLVITSFRGDKTPEQLANKDIKSLRVDCLIAGRLSGELPSELRGVKVIRILYSEYGEFQTTGGFRESSIVVPHSSKGQSLPPVEIRRPAHPFDVAETRKPVTDTEMTTTFPTIISALGAEPNKTKIRGHRYLVSADWRRKENTIEVKIRDYRPNHGTTPSPTP